MSENPAVASEQQMDHSGEGAVAPAPDAQSFFVTKKGVAVELPAAPAPIAESHTHLTSLRHIHPALALARDAMVGVRFVVTVVDPTDDARDPGALLADLAAWSEGCERILAAWRAAGVRDALGEELRAPVVRLLVGCHPHNASSFDEGAREAMRALLAHPSCCGVGEIGLDYHYDLSPRDVQRAVFAEQLELARTLGASLSLHVREAHAEAAPIMAGVGLPQGAGVVLHCFDLGPTDAAPFLEMGCVLGIGGAVTFKSGDPTREAVLGVPCEAVIFETDAPYMAPEPLRGTRCEPAMIARTAAFVAQLRAERLGEDPRATYEASYARTLQIFDRPAPCGPRA